MGVTVRLLKRGDAGLLADVHPQAFDNPVLPDEAAAFLADPGHLLVVARDAGTVVGLASGTVLRHPDKRPMLFVNELGVAPDYRRRGIARRMTGRLFRAARARGCRGIWLGTEAGNAAARGFYRSIGGRETEGLVIYDWDGAMDDEYPPR